MDGRCIFFDVDGVVVNGYHFKPELRRRWDEHLQADLGISPDVFFKEFISGVFVDEVLTGKTSLITALESVLPRLGYARSAMDIAAYWLARDTHLNLPLLEAIKQLRGRGVRLYLATNQEHLRAMQLWNGLGLKHMFDDIFYSARLGVAKPDAAFFEHVAARIGPFTEVPILFDDTPAVVEAARAAGWDAFVYNELNGFTHNPLIEKLKA